jgi:hypothetical protein
MGLCAGGACGTGVRDLLSSPAILQNQAQLIVCKIFSEFSKSQLVLKKLPNLFLFLKLETLMSCD